MSFRSLFPELGWDECRLIAMAPESSFPDVEPHTGTFILDEFPYVLALNEHFCELPDCDCQSCLLNVEEIHSGVHIAAISLDLKQPPTYRPFLEPLRPQSARADEVLQMVSEIVLQDRHYVERLRRHAALLKEKVGGQPKAKRRTDMPQAMPLDPNERRRKRKQRRKQLKEYQRSKRR